MPREVDRPRSLHRTDWMALLSGLLFVVLGILVLTGELNDSVTLGALVVVGLGFAGVVAIIARVVRGK
ncbi:hypothetical protein [Nonomuraea pusilla]|uniref:Uncharacterized protein n=1 Tax=Nonomuraea pusilla TaxID=46177 RepID=A0A1H7VGJ6_9ACTN|nr:hypothetical protein [Nonomuraea pusilla]SEM08240.1 hypothetical protein SAMN05660976_04140 [Nonomuraea pusilla]